MERLSVQLYRYNARMILRFWALHTHLEDDWLDACTGWEVGCSQLHQSRDDNEDEGQEGSGSTSPLNDSALSDVSLGLICVTILLVFWLSPHLMIVLILPLGLIVLTQVA